MICGSSAGAQQVNETVTLAVDLVGSAGLAADAVARDLAVLARAMLVTSYSMISRTVLEVSSEMTCRSGRGVVRGDLTLPLWSMHLGDDDRACGGSRR